MTYRWLSVDPGLRYTGWAYWENVELRDWGLITSKDIITTGWKLKSLIMANRVKDRVRAFDADMVICECPQEMKGGRGEMSLRSGSVRKLAYYVGMIGGRVWSRDCEFTSVEPMKWKGQLPKEITQKRVRRDYPQVPADLRSDVFDACGIGRWYVKNVLSQERLLTRLSDEEKRRA